MQIEPWQVPVLVMTLVILPPSVTWAVRRLRGTDGGPGAPGPQAAEPVPGTAAEQETEKDVQRGRWRTTVLAALTVVLVGLFFLAIGTDRANLLVTAANAVSALVSAALTVRSFLDLKDVKDEIRRIGAQQATAGGRHGRRDDAGAGPPP